jgi:hypothetical protein|tara:strand:+ start:369 stop:545 length:177 start_codon:yes stop_codon:yes gene_type:complete
MMTLKELKKTVPDRMLDVYTEGMVTVVTIPNGRLKIMPENRKPKIGYSLRNGGRKTGV